VSIVVGIDSSLTVSGCASVHFSEAKVRWETWRGRAAKPEVVTVAATHRRIILMAREVMSLVPPAFDLAVIEGPSMGGKLQASLKDERAGLRWLLINQLLSRGPVAMVSPGTRAMLAAGKGNAPKADVFDAVRSRVTGAHVPDHNVADAVALAEAGAYFLGMPVDYSAAQISAHAKVAWPNDDGPLAPVKKG
jgi:Holliday junction resolvasome RuvABC endonuclease subunit